MENSIIKKTLIALMMLSTALVSAQEENQKESADPESSEEIAKELANPNTTLGSMSFNFDYTNFQGKLPDAGSQNSFALSFQPSLPIPLNKTTNLFIRPNVPIVFTQPVPSIGGFENRGVDLGNISADVAVGKTFPSKTIAVVGGFASFRTATDRALRSPYTLLGPEIAIAQIFKWGVIGAMVNHAWNVNSVDPAIGNAQITGGQYFYVVSLKNAWQISGQPTWQINHNKPKGNKFTFPVGTGVNKITRFGKVPMKFSLQYWYYVASPDMFGPQHQVRFVITPVVPLPW